MIQHVAFWVLAIIFTDLIYAPKSSFWIAARNNVFYIPLHLIFFYATAYWLAPKYLLKNKYAWFILLTLALNLLLAVASRFIDILITYPYIIKYAPKGDFWPDTRPLEIQLTDINGYISAFKGINFIVWVAFGIKLFKMWYERKQAAVKAELSALKGQLHPHFLFNTLNNLYSLTLQNSDKSPGAVLGLSEMLRYMLYECGDEYVPLSKEILMLKNYTDLEKLRYEDRLDLTFNISGDLQNKLIAPLLLLPIIENAFKHGTSENIGQAWININIEVSGNVLKLKTSNSKADVVQADADKHFGNIGLQNVTKRLDYLYPGKHQLKILNDDEAFLVVMEVPLKATLTPLTQLKQHEDTRTYS
ncbi:hypothetical protein GCM10023149_13360 [Mucilaginibacter gynuensis]|uniref:Signal transduction histidine kinase internal region domain-containing protein n=1 Tax=Mucilaginibacter gynuensis TaxID=1302236 RepID=A0ABP8G332_9SPHI